MILCYSGCTTFDNIPEHILADKKPGVMLTYWELSDTPGYKADTMLRFKNHKRRRKGMKHAKGK